MSRIHLLTEEVCNRIAAGEVVERPSSVVKELVENSLDAGARKISVSVEKAGQKSILVRDNGEGMDTDDALLCLESHATSKIKKEEDIERISNKAVIFLIIPFLLKQILILLLYPITL